MRLCDTSKGTELGIVLAKRDMVWTLVLWVLSNLSAAHCMHAQLCPTLCNPMDCSPLGSSVHGIFQTRIVEWFAIFFSRGSSCPGIKPTSLVSPTLAGEFFTISTTRGSSHQDVSFPQRVPLAPSPSLDSVSLPPAQHLLCVNN